MISQTDMTIRLKRDPEEEVKVKAGFRPEGDRRTLVSILYATDKTWDASPILSELLPKRIGGKQYDTGQG